MFPLLTLSTTYARIVTADGLPLTRVLAGPYSTFCYLRYGFGCWIIFFKFLITLFRLFIPYSHMASLSFYAFYKGRLFPGLPRLAEIRNFMRNPCSEALACTLGCFPHD